MKDLKTVLPESVYIDVQKRVTNIRRFTEVAIELESVDKKAKEVVLLVYQKERRTDKLYSAKDLEELVYPFVDIIIDQGFSVDLTYKEFSGTGISNVSAAWVKSKMEQHGISQNKLAEALNIDKFMISKLMNNRTGFTSWSRAAVWYYFKSLENE